MSSLFAGMIELPFHIGGDLVVLLHVLEVSARHPTGPEG